MQPGAEPAGGAGGRSGTHAGGGRAFRPGDWSLFAAGFRFGEKLGGELKAVDRLLLDALVHAGVSVPTQDGFGR